MYSYDLFNMSNFMVTITDSVSKSAEGPIGLYLLVGQIRYIVPNVSKFNMLITTTH